MPTTIASVTTIATRTGRWARGGGGPFWGGSGWLLIPGDQSLLLRGRRPALSDRRLDRRIRRRSLAKEADCREANDEHNHGEEEDHLAQRRACWSGIRLWRWLVRHADTSAWATRFGRRISRCRQLAQSRQCGCQDKCEDGREGQYGAPPTSRLVGMTLVGHNSLPDVLYNNAQLCTPFQVFDVTAECANSVGTYECERRRHDCRCAWRRAIAVLGRERPNR
jgi:hypothetical protein